MLGKFAVVGSLLGALGCGPVAAACTTTIGSLMSLSGSLAVLGQKIAQGVQLGIDDLNAAGGANGCRLELALVDDRTQASAGVEAARRLVEQRRVPAIIGALSSGVSVAVLNEVTAPAGVVQISPASTSPVFAELAREGRTDGFWFRTAPSDALQGVAMAKVARDAGLQRVAVLYVQNAYGEGLSKEFAAAFSEFGGTVTQSVGYEEARSAYRPEVDRALDPVPDALFLIGYPGDGTVVARSWIASGGPAVFLLPDGLQSQDFVDDVGPAHLKTVYGTAAGSVKTPSLDTFIKGFQARFGALPTQAYIPNAYDAAVVVGLAIQQARSIEAAAIRDAIRKVTDPDGEEIHAGVDELKKAAGLLAEGKAIRYVGASGPLQFDRNGDVDGPMLTWTVADGKLTSTGVIGVAQIAELRGRLQ